MIPNEVWLAAGYALGLALIGRAFEWMAVQREREAFDPEAGAGHRPAGTGRQDDPSLAHMEAARFQRGLAIAVCFCAIYILVIVSWRHGSLLSIPLLCIAACAPGWVMMRAGRRFATTLVHGRSRLAGRSSTFVIQERKINERQDSDSA